MIYEALIYENERKERITFGVGSAYHVNVQRDVTGLSDLSNTIYSTNSMGQHGDTYAGNRIEPRDIEITGKIVDRDKDTQMTLRRNALKILNPELEGTIYYQYGDFVRKIGAKVLESPRFTHGELFQEFSIVFKCLNPFWNEENEQRTEVAAWIGDWEFPCDIELEDDEDMIFGHREESIIVDVYNDGHIKTGMRVSFRALGTLTNPQLFNINTREYIKINITMTGGDEIIIDTNYGNKSVTLKRNGAESNIYRYIDVDSTFMQLDIGDNMFRYDADSGVSNLEVTVHFSQEYLGV